MSDRRRYLSEWETQVQLDMISDIHHFHKFGENPIVGTSTETPWNFGGDYTFLDVGTALEMTCTDNVAGIGQTIRVFGLDEDFSWKTADVVTNGQTPVLLPGFWTVIHRAYQVSAAPNPVGDVYISTTAATYSGGVPQEAALVQAFLDYGNDLNQTENAFVVVPAGDKGLVYALHTFLEQSTGTARYCDVSLEVQEFVSAGVWAPRRRVDLLDISTSSPTAENIYRFPFIFPACTRIELRAKASANSIVYGEFDVIFVPDGSIVGPQA